MYYFILTILCLLAQFTFVQLSLVSTIRERNVLLIRDVLKQFNAEDLGPFIDQIARSDLAFDIR